jgi:hypothetical protein
VLQVATGIFLAMHYKADVTLSFDSIQHIMRDVNYGWLLRYLHSTGASAFFLVIYIHMARTLYYGSYRAPRELMWWTGQGLLLLLMATAFMGYLLPWGQMSFWGATVITNLFRATPFIGDQVVIWLRGDYTVGDATLTRFFALHYLFPFLIIGAVLIHLVALHTVRSSNPSGIDLKAKDNIPFHPYFTSKDFYGLGLFRVLHLRVFLPGQTDRASQQHSSQPDADPDAYRAGMVFPAVLRDFARRAEHGRRRGGDGIVGDDVRIHAVPGPLPHSRRRTFPPMVPHPVLPVPVGHAGAGICRLHSADQQQHRDRANRDAVLFRLVFPAAIHFQS